MSQAVVKNSKCPLTLQDIVSLEDPVCWCVGCSAIPRLSLRGSRGPALLRWQGTLAWSLMHLPQTGPWPDCVLRRYSSPDEGIFSLTQQHPKAISASWLPVAHVRCFSSECRHIYSERAIRSTLRRDRVHCPVAGKLQEHCCCAHHQVPHQQPLPTRQLANVQRHGLDRHSKQALSMHAVIPVDTLFVARQ